MWMGDKISTQESVSYVTQHSGGGRGDGGGRQMRHCCEEAVGAERKIELDGTTRIIPGSSFVETTEFF